jgi:hypothetical protein
MLARSFRMSRLSAGSVRFGASLAGRRPIPASLAFTRTTFSDHPVVGPRHLGVFLAEPVSRSQARFGQVSLAGHPRYQRPLPWHTPCGMLASRQRFLLSTTHPYGSAAHQQTAGRCRIPCGITTVSNSSAPIQDFLLRMPSRRPLSPWRVPCGTRQSATVPCSADLPCGSSVYWRPLPWRTPCGRRPVGNGSTLHQSSFRTTRLPQTVRFPGHPLRNISRSLLRLALS